MPEADRRRLVESGIDAAATEGEIGGDGDEDSVRPARLDACRRALVFAALALEARINRVLRCRDGAEWEALTQLGPVEKFRLAPRLLTGPEAATLDAELGDLLVQVFTSRDELVDEGETMGVPLTHAVFRLSPSHVRVIVAASAKICSVLAALAGLDESGIAQLVRRAADALTLRADRFSALRPSGRPSFDWNGFEDFPPNVIGS